MRRSAVLTLTSVILAAPAAHANDARAPLAVDHQLRGYFIAGGETQGLGGFAPSGNHPTAAKGDPDGQVRLVVRPDQPAPFREHRGHVVYLITVPEGCV